MLPTIPVKVKIWEIIPNSHHSHDKGQPAKLNLRKTYVLCYMLLCLNWRALNKCRKSLPEHQLARNQCRIHIHILNYIDLYWYTQFGRVPAILNFHT